MKNRIRGIAVAVLALVLAAGLPDAFGWGDKGHQVIAIVAERRLATEVAAEVKRLLNAEPEPSLPAVSTWADNLRANPQFGFTLKGHYIDIPLSADGGDLRRYCPKDDCITESLLAVRKALADRAMDDARRSQALKFFVHLVADVHQPLHCASRVNDETPQGDRGGNLVRVRHGSAKTNLHAAWDSYLVDDIVEDARTTAIALDAGITSSQVNAWTAGGDPASWTWECFKIAKAVAYGGQPFRASDITELDSSYVKAAHTTIREQFAKAGVRLAFDLNKALGRPGQASIKDIFYPERPREKEGPPPSPKPSEPPSEPTTVATPASTKWPVLWLSVAGAVGVSSVVAVAWWRHSARQRRVFVSYRRATTQGHAGRIADRLGSTLGRANVFRDVDSVFPGEDFIDAIDARLAVCDAVVAVLGPSWAADPRLREPDDYVRRELTRALEAGIPVVPVLVQDATMPSASELPEELRTLSRRNAISIVDQLFDASVGALVAAIRQLPRRSRPDDRVESTTR